ncbi:MAG: hypothetical protein WDA10_11125 [Porticoccaceae bacterium]
MPLRSLRANTWIALLLGLALLPARLLAAEVELPVTLDYGVVNQALGQQLFRAADGSAEVFSDGLDCNALTLADPWVEGTLEGQLRITTRVLARGGTPLGGRCLLPFEWTGVIETLEEAYVPPGTATIAFRIVDSRILTADQQNRSVPGVVWDWIKRYIHPQLGAVTVNLSPAVIELQSLLREALPADSAARDGVADSLVLKAVTTHPEGIDVVFRLDAPPPPEGWTPAPQPVLSAAELARWDAAWQSWDGFATWLILGLAAPADPDLRGQLADILLEARHDLRDALASDRHEGDPVRALFLNTWSRLAPLLRDNAAHLPGAEAIQFATFISAANALQALDRAAPHLGLELDRHTLRSLARTLAPAVSDEELDYDTDVDPRLRGLLGLDPDFGEAPEAPLPFVWVIPRAEAAPVDPALVKTLTGWVPAATEIDDYLATMDRLIDESLRIEREAGKVPVAFLPIYEDMVRATAWQETCWRQFIERNGRVQPIQSAAGSVGLMQINKHVWRGIYDLDALQGNVAYNARAGNEILRHYLVDYAIKRKEHEISGDRHNLARATYGVYNGGPRHLSRYRNPETSNYLKGIDAAFWQKYQAIRKQGAAAVKGCYGG